MNIKHYEEIYAKFKECSPHLAKLTVDYRPRGDTGIRVTLDDGERYDYDIHYPAPRRVENIRLEDAVKIDDQQCRDVFAYRMKDLMKRRGFNQVLLSEYTGISRATISNYINAKNTPTLIHMRKIAHALDCTIGELTD